MKKKIEALSVIMSVKNGEKFLHKAIDSILNQTFKNFEFIIINNDSSDSTQEILENFLKKNSRIKILTNFNNETLYQARIKAIKEAKYEWCALMDADDECHPQRFEKQVDFINNTEFENLAVVSTYGKYINKNSTIVANFFSGPKDINQFKNIFSNNDSFAIIDPSSIIKKDIFFKIGGYLENNIAADLDFYYKIAEAGYLIQTIASPLYYYRIHGGGYSVKNTMKQCKATHFLNYNMRLRRSGKEEITEQQFNINFWNKASYRIPRKILDYSKTYYKISTHSLVEKKIFTFFLNIILAFLFSPRYVLKKIYQQLFKKI